MATFACLFQSNHTMSKMSKFLYLNILGVLVYAWFTILVLLRVAVLNNFAVLLCKLMNVQV